VPGKRGLLTTASDELHGVAHSRRLASRPVRPVFLKPAPSRGPVGSITPQAKVRRPYIKAPALSDRAIASLTYAANVGAARTRSAPEMVSRAGNTRGNEPTGANSGSEPTAQTGENDDGVEESSFQ
jgi:hypothetical protein